MKVDGSVFTVHGIVKCWEAAAICFYECCTMGVNNIVDYYYESLQLQLIWLATVGTFSSHNGSRIDSKNIILNEHFVFVFLSYFWKRDHDQQKKNLFTINSSKPSAEFSSSIRHVTMTKVPIFSFFYVFMKFNWLLTYCLLQFCGHRRVLAKNPVEYVRRIAQLAPVSNWQISFERKFYVKTRTTNKLTACISN